MKSKLFFNNLYTIIILLFISTPIFSQDLRWTGGAGDADFFNETNWKESVSGTTPTAGTVNPNQAINRNLNIENASGIIGGTNGLSANILMGTGNLSIKKSTLKIGSGYGIEMGDASKVFSLDSAILYSDFLKNATLTITGNSKVYLTGTAPFISSNLKFNSFDAWVFIPKINASVFENNHTATIKIFDANLINNTNARIIQYYNGTALSAYKLDYKPLTVFDNINLAGNSGEVIAQNIISGNNFPPNLTAKISSFKLKKGYMVTLAVNADGTGLSKVYIASESDLIINALPPALNNSINFIRVVPWVWVNKKGTGGNITNIGGSWYYNWGLSANSSPDREYAPMGWGKTSLDTQTKINSVVNKSIVTHIMSFNESDNCDDQSGKFGSLCVEDTAVIYHANCMKTGLRIVSPSCREGEETKWVKNLNNLAIPLGTRMDVIGMHWYDWGANPTNTPDEDPVAIFNRFKNKVIACYNYYKMPIWITEFNANKFRNRWVQDEFLKLALPWLEATPYVERYAYFQPDGGKGSFFDSNGSITSTGSIYLNQISTPSITEENRNKYVNNLESRMNESNPSTITTQKSTKEITFYPNPLKGSTLKINIIDNLVSDYTISIIDLHGKPLFKSQYATGACSIELNSPLNPGIYILKINTANSTDSFKLIAQN